MPYSSALGSFAEVCLVLVSLVAIIGNSVGILACFLVQPKYQPKLRPIFLALAIVDLANGLLACPFLVVATIVDTGTVTHFRSIVLIQQVLLDSFDIDKRMLDFMAGIPVLINICCIGYMLLLAIAKWLPLTTRQDWQAFFFKRLNIHVHLVWITAMSVFVARTILCFTMHSNKPWFKKYRWFEYTMLYVFHVGPLLIVLFFNYLTFRSISR